MAAITGVMTRDDVFRKIAVNPDQTDDGKKIRRYEFNSSKAAYKAQEVLSNAANIKGRNLSPVLQNIVQISPSSQSAFLIKELLSQAYVDRVGDNLSLSYKNEQLRQHYFTQLDGLLEAQKKNKVLTIQTKLNSFLSLAITEERRIVAPLTGVGKVVVKAGSEGACKILYKQAGVISKETGKKFVKKVPVIGLVMGVALGVFRLYHGEPGKALLEVASGGLSCFPGAGTAASVVIDLGLICGDLSSKETVIAQLSDATIEEGKRIFGLDNAAPMTEDAINRAFRRSSAAFHPDKYANFPALQRRCTKIQQNLQKTKDILIRQCQ